MSVNTIPSLLASFLERLEAGISGGEALSLEFKKEEQSLPQSIWPTVSAFANTSGGWIILGIDESQNPVAITGISRAADMLQSFRNLSRNRQKVSVETCGAHDAAVEVLDDKEIIVIRIRAASRKQRPVYINGNPYEGTFVRRHEGDYLCTKPEVDRMMREASDVVADSHVLEHYGWEDLDPKSFASYRQRFQNLDPTHDWNAYNDTRFLRAIGGYGRDRDRGIEGLTVAGLLMFGREDTIREWRTNHLLDFRLLPGSLDTAATWIDRIDWHGNLLGAFDAMYPKLIAGLPSPIHIEDGVRQDHQGHLAVREALVNLLVHADYAETRSSLIFSMPEGFLFRNPGDSRVPEMELGLGHQSDARNPSLVLMFRRLNLAEQAGSGIRRIRDTWRDLGYRVPLIDVGTERYEFSLHLNRLHLLSVGDRHWLQQIDPLLTQSEQTALLIALHEDSVDNITLRRRTGEHSADTTKVLRSLRDRGFLEMIGDRRGARYQLTPHCLAISYLTDPDYSIDSRASSMDTEPNSMGSGESSMGLPTDSIESTHGLESIEAEIERMIVSFRASARAPATAMQRIVILLCGQQPRSIRELATILARTPLYISQSVVNPLVAAGHLRREHPDTPNHPRQRYIATAAPPEIEKIAEEAPE